MFNGFPLTTFLLDAPDASVDRVGSSNLLGLVQAVTDAKESLVLWAQRFIDKNFACNSELLPGFRVRFSKLLLRPKNGDRIASIGTFCYHYSSIFQSVNSMEAAGVTSTPANLKSSTTFSSSSF